MNFIFYVVGATNVGKSTFLDAIKTAYPKEVHLVEVGKWMRLKYPPEFFKGQGAPQHTQVEAMEMLFRSIDEANRNKAQFVLVDGQPRNVGQVDFITRELLKASTHPRTPAVIELVCSRGERERRLRARDLEPAVLDLGLVRLDRDVLDIHEVLLEFTAVRPFRFHTGRADYSPVGAFQRVLRGYGLENFKAQEVIV